MSGHGHHSGNTSKHQQQHHHASCLPKRHRDETEARNAVLIEKRLVELLRERRILWVITFLCCTASILWIVSLSTDYWILIDLVPKNRTASVLQNHLGIWRGCVVHRNSGDSKTTDSSSQSGDAEEEHHGCTFHNMNADSPELLAHPSIAATIIDYRRTVMALAALSLLCHSLSLFFSFYTFKNPKYIFKRLAGCLLFMTAAIMVVLIEVVSNGAEFARTNLISVFPVGSFTHKGYSYYLAWVVFMQYGIAGIAFIFCSRKRKNLNITGEDGLPLTDEDILRH